MKLQITTAITIITLLFGAWFYIDNTKANASDVQRLEQRLDRKILRDDIKATRERIWVLKDRFGEHLERATITILEEYRELVNELQDLREEYKGSDASNSQ